MVAIGVTVAGIVVLVHAFIVRRAGSQLVAVGEQLAAILQERPEHEAGTDPATVERLESLERRFEALASDAQKWYRKAAQERRRIEGAQSDDDDDETLAGAAQLRLPQLNPTAPPNGRRRLRRPSRGR